MTPLAAYLQRRDANEAFNQESQAGELRQAGALQAMLANADALRKKQAYEQEMAALPPDADEETRARTAMRHASPDVVVRTQQDALNRKEAAKERALAISAQLDAKQAALNQQRELALQRAQDKQSQDAVLNGFKAKELEMKAERDLWMKEFQRQNLDIKGMLAEQAAKKSEQPKPDAGMTPENAGKVAMAQQAVQGIDTVRGIVFDKEGKMNRGLIGAMNLPIVSGLPGNSQARIARSAIRNAVEAKLRIETGAAATESEVERTLARFLPTIADTPDSAKFKLDELDKFFRSSLSLTKGVAKPAATGGAQQRMRFDAQGNPVTQ